ncbi:MAG: ferritin-like domain-containing protein [Sandaracinus sp.]
MSDEERDAACFGWAVRIVDEYRSVVVFTELLGHLAAIRAPYAALATVQRLIGDELRHTRLCAEVASWFGSLDALAIDLEDLELPAWEGSREERALEIVVRELVIGEGESVACMRVYRDATTDPAVRAALSTLLADEVRHYAAGRALEALLRETLPPALVERASARLDARLPGDVASIRRAHRAGATGGPGRRFGVSVRPEETPPLVV